MKGVRITFQSISLKQPATWWKLCLLCLLILILARFLIAGKAKVLFNAHSSDGDESAYLALGLALREAGILTDGTRPPFYPLLLTPVAQREWSYFTWAKFITLGLGAATVLATFLVGQRLFNWETGFLAAFLLAANKEFHLRASTIYADTLLVGLFVLAWYFLIRSFETSRDRYLAGFLVGLAYLTKGSATLLLVAWGLTALLYYRLQILRAYRPLLVVPLVFLLTISPLVIYNGRHFGSPFYNFATTHVMWMDRWAQSQVADPADLPTMATYLQTHSLADIWGRLQSGSARLNTDLFETLIPSRTLEPDWFSIALPVVGLVLASWLLWSRPALVQAAYRRYRITIWLSFWLLLPFYFFSAWYAQVMMESRFLIPILGPFYLLLAAGFMGLMRGLRAGLGNSSLTPPFIQSSVQWSIKGLAALIVAWGFWWLITTTQIEIWSLGVNAFESDQGANTEAEVMVTWLIRDHPPARGPARVIFGPSKSLPLWKFPPHFSFDRIPVDVDTWEALQKYLQDKQPHYLIIDSDTARRRRDVLSDYFSYDERGIGIERLPEGWNLAYMHAGPSGSPGLPYPWSVFTPFARPETVVRATFADQLALLGYDLIFDKDARTLHVALYWQATASIADDYTLFLHLTAPDGFVKAQQDRQPFAGLWPTSAWLPGDVVADRFDILLDESVAPGQYLLLTGLYRLATGERLPLVEGPPAPSSDAVLLGHVEVE